MPLYEYQCKACANRFERIVKFSDPPLKTCPQCGLDTIEQMISAPAVQFKGSGWYVTDYAKKNSSQGSSAPAKSDAGETVSASNGSDKGTSAEKSASGSNGASASSGDSASPASGTGAASAGASSTSTSSSTQQ